MFFVCSVISIIKLKYVFKEVICLVVRKFYLSSINPSILLHFLFLPYSQVNLTLIFFKLIVYHFNKVIFITQTILFIFVYKRHLECLLSRIDGYF